MPFRTGHHFASKLTDYGRSKGRKLHEIPFAEVQRIYAEKANEALPLVKREYADIISAEFMVIGRNGLEGAQVKETRRFIAKGLTALELDRDRTELNCEKIAGADGEREKEFRGHK